MISSKIQEQIISLIGHHDKDTYGPKNSKQEKSTF